MKVLRGRARGATAEGAVARRGNRKPYQAWPSDKARAFQRLLLDWYQEHRRELPWRSSPTPYRVWVSEIMLQQTRVRTVLAYFDKFIRRFPDIRTLAEASDEEVSRYWAGLGYYSRARNLHHAAQKIAREFAGSFPDSLEEILKLPGIGRTHSSRL